MNKLKKNLKSNISLVSFGIEPIYIKGSNDYVYIYYLYICKKKYFLLIFTIIG